MKAGIVQLSDKQLQTDRRNWTQAKEWVNWWTKEKVARMFQKSFMEMTEADYDFLPHDSNAAESHNKLSDSRTSNFEATFWNIITESIKTQHSTNLQ